MADRSKRDKDEMLIEGPRQLRPEEHGSAIELLNRVLRPTGPRTMLQEYPLALGKENLQNMRVVVHEGRVVAHAAVYFSRLRAGEMVFGAGGISSVVTDPRYRGRGFGSSVVRDCLRIIEESGSDLAILWTQRHNFYRHLGFEAAGGEYLFQLHPSTAPAGSASCIIEPYSPEYLSEIIQIHEQEGFRTERSSLEYETYFALPRADTLVSLRKGRVTAYAVMGKGEDFKNCIHEWGGRPDDLLFLAQAFAATASQDILILTPTVQNEFVELLRRMKLREIFEPLAMMKAIDIQKLAAKILAHHRLHLSVEGGDITINFQGRQARLLHERMLVRLLFGPDQPEYVLAEVPPAMLRALKKALPVSLFIWGLDSV